MDGPAGREEGRELLVLRLGSARFGVWVDEALEVVPTPPISRLPLAHDEVPGVTSVRGDVIPVLDLGVRLLGEPAARPGRIVIVRHRDTAALVALLVDDVETVISVGDEELRAPPPDAGSPLSPDHVAGVFAGPGNVVTVLHLGRAAAPPRRSPSGR
jgi:purine-binding chemotaxis protein CheW